MREPFIIGEHKVEPGSRQLVELKLASGHSHNSVGLPVHAVHGKYQGPVLFVSAAIHGDEIDGVEVIRRLLSLKTLKRLHGTLLAIPVVNEYGFTANSRYLPDRRDLNRSFPGSPTGSLGSRLAHLFIKEIVERSTHGIDLHTASHHRTNLPQIRANLDDPTTRWLAQTFDVPVLINSKVRDGSLRGAAVDKNTPTLLYEGGEALRFDEVTIRAAVRGIVNVMKALEMIPSRGASQTSVRGTVAKSTKWVRAPMQGILRARKLVGDRVKVGEEIGVVYDPYDHHELVVPSPISGVVIGRTNLPTVNEGDALFHIANFEQIGEVESALEHFGELLDPQEEKGLSGTMPII